MANNPIGIFDSGIGGLSVLNEIRRLLPHEELIYIADSAFAPYGNKPHAFILQRCEELSRFLIEQKARAIVIACNTATAVAVSKLREQFSLPIIAMEPGVKPAIAATKSAIVGVLATQNTLASEQFTDLLHRYAENVQVISQPCPGLVEQIETGEFDSEATKVLLKKYTEPLLSAGADTIVLGCTHYPLLKKQIAELVGEAVSIIETGPAVAQQLKHKLEEQQGLSQTKTTGAITFWTSDDAVHSEKVTHLITGEAIKVRTLPSRLLKQN